MGACSILPGRDVDSGGVAKTRQEVACRSESDERGPLHKTAPYALGKGDRSNRSLVTKGIKRNQQRYITKGHVPNNSQTLNNLPEGVAVKKS